MSATITERLRFMGHAWSYVWEVTHCADCAEKAALGQPWGSSTCWAQHRDHGETWFVAGVS